MKSLENLYKRLNQNLKARALSFEGTPGKDLKRYRQDLHLLSKKKILPSSQAEMLEQIADSDVIYLGDFHTFDQSSKNLERLIKVLLKKNTKNKLYSTFILGLEMVHAKDQLYIDAYLSKEITEREFLESIHYYESWRFPWTHYRAFFELARKEKFIIRGLNSKGTLGARDRFAAQLINQSLVEFPGVPVLVLFGEYHIVKNKIPALTKKQCAFPLKQTIIHQNLEEVYWKLLQTKDINKVTKFNDQEFHLNTTPPWVKYESMAYWYENLNEDADYDVHNYIIQTGLKTLNSDGDEQFLMIIKELLKSLNLKLPKNILEDFNLYDQTRLETIEEKISKIKEKKTRDFTNFLITTNQSFKFLHENSLYCPNYSINRLSYLGGIFIYSKFLETNKHGQPEFNFNYFLESCLFGFLFAKIFNPYRKCDLYLDYELKLKQPKLSPLEKKICRMTMRILDDEASYSKELKNQDLSVIYQVAKNIGHILGENLYNSYKAAHHQKFKSALSQYLKANHFAPGRFDELKNQLLPNKLYRLQKKKIF